MVGKAARQQRDERLVLELGIDLGGLKNAREAVTDSLSGLLGSRPERRAMAAESLGLSGEVFDRAERYLHDRLDGEPDRELRSAIQKLSRHRRPKPKPDKPKPKPDKPKPKPDKPKPKPDKPKPKPDKPKPKPDKPQPKPKPNPPMLRLSTLNQGRHPITGKLVRDKTAWALCSKDGKNYRVTLVEEKYPSAHVNRTKDWILIVTKNGRHVSAITKKNAGEHGSVPTVGGGLPGQGRSRKH